MGHLFLVRHAPTDASQEGRNLGQASDPPLSAPGLQLAGRLAQIVAAEIRVLGPDAARVVTSPALRCRQTADAIRTALPGVPVAEPEAGLLEIDYGSWDGLTADECSARDPQLRAAWEADPFATRAPGGESGADVAARAFPILEGIGAWTAGEATRCAVVVAHNHVNRLWLTHLFGWPMSDYRRRLAQDPAGYSLIGFSDAVVQVRRVNAGPMER